MYKPEISVIVPVFNAAPYLTQCIDSIITPRRTDVELILVDDGSTDQSFSICNEYSINYPETIKFIHKENGGVSSARNLGLSRATGRWITFVDADDMLLPGAIDVLLKSLNESDADVLQFGLTRDLKIRNMTSSELSPEDYVRAGLCQVCAGGTVIKHSILIDNNIKFDECMALAEDQIFILQAVFKSSSVRRISDILYYYRDNQTSATNHPSVNSILISIDKLIDFKTVNMHVSSIIDRTLLSFIYLLILSDPCDLSDIKAIYQRCMLADCVNVNRGVRIFYLLSRFNFTFAAKFVKFFKSIQ